MERTKALLSLSNAETSKGSILIPYNFCILWIKMIHISRVTYSNINKSKTMKPEQKLLNILIFSRK